MINFKYLMCFFKTDKIINNIILFRRFQIYKVKVTES
jgi:hypothetical protein